MEPTIRRILTGLLVLVAAGCGDAPAAVDAGNGDAQAVDGGPLCTSDDDCAGALVCTDGLCQREGCTEGTEGCAGTRVGDLCGRGADGNPLVCMDRICSSTSCPTGTTGCVCLDGEVCTGEGDTCVDGYCLGECAPGTERCSCLAGSCDANLVCLDGSLCVDDDGYEGGPCLPTGRCHAGARCNASLDVCVHCEPGSEGCSCTDAGTCNLGMACNAGLCISTDELPPASPVCYTPCRDSLTSGGTTRVCDAEGLMEGCIGDLECVDGSCVMPGASPPSCTSDIECPSHQACLLGRCYSNCDDSLDCPSGTGCNLHVCRVPCQSLAGSDPCPTGTFCDARDGENGYCMPMADPGTGTPPAEPTEGFSLDRASVSFSNVRTQGAITVLVQDAEGDSHEFTVRRISHVVMRRGATVEERVDARRDPDTGELLPCDAVRGECPLTWLGIAPTGMSASTAPEVSFTGTGGCEDGGTCPTLTITNAAGVDATRWQGVLEISGNGGRTTVTLDYVERADGQWVGTMHYFANFPTAGLATWAARADRSDTTGVQNGLVTRWGAFRRGNLAGGWHEMQAILTSTETGSWQFGRVRDACPSALGACYPYTNSSGVRTYVTSLATTPIPTATSELPFTMNLRQPGFEAVALTGRVDSGGSLHYPGNPSVTVNFAADPSSASACSPAVTTDCVVFMQDMTTTSVIGGRYPSRDGTCASGFLAVTEPWLADGFEAGTTEDDTGQRFRTWCVDGELPYGSATTDDVAANRLLAGANPVPDGVARSRTLRVLDGALINQSEMFFLFAEELEGFVNGETVTSYGYVVLQRQIGALDDTDEDADGVPDMFVGNTAPTVTRTAPISTGAQCDSQLVRDITNGAIEDPAALGSASLAQLVDVLLHGTQPASGSILPMSEVHYYCEETGLFDGGAADDGSASPVRIACPRGSRITYFSTRARTQAQIAAESCQRTVSCRDGVCTGGTCQATLNLWLDAGIVDVYEPYYRCNPVGGVDVPYCDENRLDLRSGKTFYRPAVSTGRTFDPLQASIEAAFRYRTRFTSSSGSRPGFAPRICLPGSDLVPYCYDPAQIEEIRDRIDCLLDVYTDDATLARLSTNQQALVQGFLKGDFAQYPSTPTTSARDGFERLYAELLVMQGDEALTQAFLSRFDLAAAGGASFEGSLFEPDGIDLSGVAGFEMVSLYRAVQLYQLALDRLYALGPNLTEALSRDVSVDSALVFVSAETVVLHLERLIRASTQRARAYSEIARRYQRLNRPDLARAVVQRAYTSAFLESVVIVQLMDAIADRSTRADRPQIDLAITQALRRYRMAMLDMRDLYGTITDDLNFFGFEPDFIPFPPLDASARGRNAFEVTMEIAQTRAQFARMREDQALTSNRSFQTDAAQFQAELVRLRNTYETQLGDLCGTFVSELDGRVYPATRRYASESRYPEQLGDPCGRLGNGQIHQSLVEVQQATTAQQLLNVRLANVLEEVEIERQRVSDQCDLTVQIADYQYTVAGETRDLEADIMRIRTDMELMSMEINGLADLASGLICVPNTTPTGDFGIGCANEAIDGSIRFIAAQANVINTTIGQDRIARVQRQIANTERSAARWTTLRGCDAALIDSNARTATLLLQLQEIELEMLRADRTTHLAIAEVGRLFNSAQRLQTEQAESEELLIDVESARNDPNVRVYRNDAVLNADLAFDDAIRMAYRATRVYEYYTSQSYPRLEQLFLIRMIGAGEYNLENYLLQLQNAFLAFEEEYGAPDTRVMVLSLRDDILQIPRIDEDGRSISDTRRIELMLERLHDVDLLDANGYLTMSFGTSTSQLSPLTRNHKILYVETEIVGTGGDNVARIYLRPTGTGVIHALDGSEDYYIFPQRTAVVNAFFNGSRTSFTPEVYQNQRLRDRPLVTTSWDLIFNQRDEVVNQDIDLDQLTDIRVYVYYQDFTAL